MLKENDEIRKEVNADIWHKAGFTGKGVTIALIDDGGKPRDYMKSWYRNEVSTTGIIGHATNVGCTAHELSPGIKVVALPQKQASFDWLKTHKDEIDLINMSISGIGGSHTPQFLQYEELDIPIICASGNDGEEDRVGYPAAYDFTIAIGAYSWKLDIIASYSNGGDELDAVTPSGIYMQRDDGKIWVVNGTSFSAPTACGLLACYIQWRNENGLPKLKPEEARKFIHENCKDIEEEGFDYASGHGLFCLPATIPIVEVKPIEPTPDPIKEKEIITMPRIYISPSTQQDNIGISPFRTEETEMNAIADILMQLLDDDGRFEFKRNSPSMSPNQCAYDSNAFKADIHLAIHSNAGGGEGTEVYAYAPNTNSEKLSKCLYNKIFSLSPGKDRGVKFNKNLIEVGDAVNATSSLIELAFHDNKTDATWIANNHQVIAQSLYMGLCDYFGYSYKEIVIEPAISPPVPSPEIIKRVIEFNAPAEYPTPDHDVYIAVRVRCSIVDELVRGLRDSGFSTKMIDLP